MNEISPRVAAAISAIPDDSPSSPSMKLIELIIPTIHTTVNPTAYGPVSTMLPGPNGLATFATVTPAATASPASASWPSSCQRARSWKVSSRTPMTVATAPPTSSPASSVSSSEAGTGTVL